MVRCFAVVCKLNLQRRRAAGILMRIFGIPTCGVIGATNETPEAAVAFFEFTATPRRRTGSAGSHPCPSIPPSTLHTAAVTSGIASGTRAPAWVSRQHGEAANLLLLQRSKLIRFW